MTTTVLLTPGAHYAVADTLLRKVAELEDSLRPIDGVVPAGPEQVAGTHALQAGLATIALAHATLANASGGTFADAKRYAPQERNDPRVDRAYHP